MEFEVREIFEKKDMRELNVAIRMRNKMLKTTEKISRGFSRFFGVVFLLTAISAVRLFPGLFSEMPGENGGFIVYGMIMLVLVGVLLLLPRRGSALNAWLTWKNYKNKGMEITCRFTESEFTEHTLVSDHRYQYSTIERVVESPTHVFLFVNAGSAHIIRKDAFILGEPDVFGTWVAGKCGKERIKIK